MQETCTNDSAITLFGMKIPLPADEYSPAASGDYSFSSEKLDEDNLNEEYEQVKDCSANKVVEDNQAPSSDSEKSTDPESSPDTNVNPKTPAISEESAKSKTSKTEREQNDSTTNSQEKTLKKPDKILPCPRCNSMDTKFCYYNNYNVNQPRHFCKACQRYWTAGGTMRNVPVGAGRRKNKNSASHYRHITISEALQAARIEVANGAHHPALKTNGRVLSFGLDAPICDSMASVLNLADKKVLNGTRNGFHVIEDQRIRVPTCKGGENGDDCSSGSSVTVSNSVEEGGRVCQPESFVDNINGAYPSPIPCIPDVPWPYPALPPPAFYHPGIPMPFYPTAYWNCGMTGPWNIPLLSPSRTSLNQRVSGTNPNSSTLGKHSRDSDSDKPEELENERPSKHKNGCVLVPKILRIDDPSEAAKSSIWATLGIKNESLSGKGGLFKGFQSKCEEKNRITEKASPALMANPAALSRSLNFHEST